MNSRKAELSTQQIILLIVLIASFIVLLFFLFRLNIGKESGNQLCRNSVNNKGSPVSSLSSGSLTCYTQDICITKNGDCGELVKPFEKIKVKDLNETYSVLADKMADCWWMF